MQRVTNALRFGSTGGFRAGSARRTLTLILTAALLSTAAYGQGPPDIVWMLGGNNARVDSIVYSPDGETMGTLSRGSVKLWRVSDGLLAHTLSSSGRSIAFSPDGQMLASGHTDGVRLWRVDDGSLVRTIGSALQESVAFSPDGELLASAQSDGIALWRVADGSLVRMIGSALERSVVFSPNGQLLASVSGTIKLWRVSDGVLIRNIFTVGGVNTLAFSPDGQALASGEGFCWMPDCEIICEGVALELWRVSDGSLIRSWNPGYGVRALAFSPNGQLLASAHGFCGQCAVEPVECFGMHASLWRVSDGSRVRSLTGHEGPVLSVAFSADGEVLASGSSDRQIKLWRVSNGSFIGDLAAHTASAVAEFTPDGETLVSAGSDYTAKLWRVSDGSLIREVPVGWRDESSGVSVSPDAQFAAWTGTDFWCEMRCTKEVWESWVEVRRISDGSMAFAYYTGRYGPYTCCAQFSPDARLMYADVNPWHIWRVSDWSLIHTKWANYIAFSPDGQMMASSDREGIELWRVSDWSLMRSLSAPSTYVMEFSPDGQMLAAVDDTRIGLWRVSDGSLIDTLTGHSSRVGSLEFSADGQVLLSGSGSEIKVWQIPDGILMRTYDQEVTPGISSLRFSPDGQLFAYGRGDGTVVLAGNPLCDPADTNCDGDVNALDIEPFLDLLFDPSAVPCSRCAGDVNCDGNVNALDIEPLLMHLFNAPPFKRPASQVTGRKPNAIASGDFDCDGTIDLAVGLAVELQGVMILFGNGDGGFDRTAFTPLAGDSVTGLAAGDFDGDDDLDLAVTNFRTPVRILWNVNCTGSFVIGQSIPGLDELDDNEDVVAGDLNHDDILDLVISNYESYEISILLGNPDGTFTLNQQLSAGENPIGVAISDIDGDGDQDVLVANRRRGGGGSVMIYRGTPSGTVILAKVLSVPAGARSVIVANLDDDQGSKDLAVACESSDSIVVLRHLSGLDYAPLGPDDVLPVNNRPRMVRAADFDGDGDIDLVAACTANPDGSMDYIENAGDGTFHPARSIPLGVSADSLVVRDFNRDGVPDAAVCLFGEDTIQLLLNAICVP